MTFKVEWMADNGEHGYADGSTFGRSFGRLEDAIHYAMGYARAVAGRDGRVDTVGPVNDAGWYLTARKSDGYYEEVRIITA